MSYPMLPTFAQSFLVDFKKTINENVNVKINKDVKAVTFVVGNLGNANADAKAFGGDTLAETLTLTSAIQGYSSSAFSESTSGTNGAYSHYLIG